MSIHVSEPGRPLGTRLPEIYRRRTIGDVTELTESHAINTGYSEATDAEFQQAANSGRHRALKEYGAAVAGEPPEQRPYLPVSKVCSPAHFSLPATASIEEALTAMEEKGVQHLVVTAEGNVAGLVEMRWLLGWLHEHRGKGLKETLLHIELPGFLTASPETDAHQLARLMLAHQLNAALVVDSSGKPTGIVTSTDYLRLYASEGRQQGSV